MLRTALARIAMPRRGAISTSRLPVPCGFRPMTLAGRPTLEFRLPVAMRRRPGFSTPGFVHPAYAEPPARPGRLTWASCSKRWPK